jgi:hypothetical protein
MRAGQCPLPPPKISRRRNVFVRHAQSPVFKVCMKRVSTTVQVRVYQRECSILICLSICRSGYFSFQPYLSPVLNNSVIRTANSGRNRSPPLTRSREHRRPRSLHSKTGLDYRGHIFKKKFDGVRSEMDDRDAECFCF